MGERGLKVTYDPFFKHIFNPESHPADLLVRQYDVAREDQGKDFSYHSIKPVYIIVLMEEIPRIFRETHGDVFTKGNISSQYIHRSRFSFDTGLKMNSLQNFIYISLDIVRRMEHNDLTELDAWLYFLGSDDPADILRIVNSHPIFREFYQDIVDFRFQPKELISMYSNALRIMDQNTVKYMIDELKAELSAQKAAYSAELSQKDSELSQKDSEIEKLRTQLARYEAQDHS